VMEAALPPSLPRVAQRTGTVQRASTHRPAHSHVTLPQPGAPFRPPSHVEWVRTWVDNELDSDFLRQRLEAQLSSAQPTRSMHHAEVASTTPKQFVPVGVIGVWDHRKLASTAIEDPWWIWGTAKESAEKQELLLDIPTAKQSLNFRIHQKATLASTKQPTAMFRSGLTASTPAWAWQGIDSTFTPEEPTAA
jgi:hypothetical protein